uniref:Major Facilitator Superfamily (MFS) putative n=1 Tax=Albugo laibachii Nc14 TaxID=890382 RepID=F0W0B5_9STRA|nr:Major Facilitator Superfamily (MFS) putative [Albugo laibachii Nc14]|eukprot:CCA14487.1 Major Facilitator Superfamily (MFS) putative [Albugo laibachii Nc14]
MVFIIKSGPIWPYFIFQLISDGFQIISIGSASIADFVPPQDRARAFGLNMAFMLVGYSLSSLVEIRLSKYHVLTLSAILHVFRWLFSLFFIFETLPSSARKQSFRWSQCLNPLRSFSILNRTSSYRKLTGLIGLVSFAASGMRQIQPFYLNTTANFTDSDIARHFLIYGVSCILAQTCCLPTLMRFCGQEKGVVIISFFFYIIPCLTYVLLVWYPYKWIVFATDGFSGIQVLSHTAITSLFSTSSALQEQGRLQGAIVGNEGAAGLDAYFAIYFVHRLLLNGDFSGVLPSECQVACSSSEDNCESSECIQIFRYPGCRRYGRAITLERKFM